jgi:hypothetical protein
MSGQVIKLIRQQRQFREDGVQERPARNCRSLLLSHIGFDLMTNPSTNSSSDCSANWSSDECAENASNCTADASSDQLGTLGYETF